MHRLLVPRQVTGQDKSSIARSACEGSLVRIAGVHRLLRFDVLPQVTEE